NDCENLSRQLGTILDVEELVPGGRYQLEVSSPEVERKLFRPKDFERFLGERIKVTLHQARADRKTFESKLSAFQENVNSLEVAEPESLKLSIEWFSRSRHNTD